MSRPMVIAPLLADLDGSDLARERVRVLLGTFSHDQQVQDAAAALGITPQRFHDLRRQILQGAVAAAEPKPLGRPAAPAPDPQAERIAHLEQRIRDLTIEREIADLRAELLAAGMGGKLKRLQKKRH